MVTFRTAVLFSLSLCTGVQPSESEVVLVEPGDTIALHCPGPESVGAAEYWEIPEGTRVPVPSSSETYVTNTTTLTIWDVQEGDAGRYQCHRHGAEDDQTAAVQLAVRARPYWQKHCTSLALAMVAACGFLLGGAAMCLVHHYRYERRHKTVATVRSDGLSEAHSNLALEIKDETHL